MTTKTQMTVDVEGGHVQADYIEDGTHYVRIFMGWEGEANVPYIIGQMNSYDFRVSGIDWDNRTVLFTKSAA